MNEILRAPLGQVPYAIWGWGLMIFKYAVEFGVIYAFAGTIYTPWAFLLPFITVKASAFGPQPTWLGAFVLLWSLPFVAIAIILSSRRCIDAGRSAWDGLLVLCPLVNLVFMVAMCFVPASPKRPEYSDQEVSSSRSSSAMAAVISIALGLLPGAAMLILGVYVLRDYGAGLFFVAPIVMSAITSYSFRVQRAAGLRTCMLVSLTGVTAALGLLLVFALEGFVCIFLAAPLVYGAGAIGALVGFAIALSQDVRNNNWRSAIMILPLVAIGDHQFSTPLLRQVTSSIDIDAPVEAVWPAVIEFPSITEPPRGWFWLGVAYPLSARIEGTGVGAIRYCEFSTGAFEEPITVWDEPYRLAFDVSRQPHPMRELSPYRDLHPPHLEGFMSSQRGEFRLVRLPNNRTRLEGRTWYHVDMYPQDYWQLWCDHLIHDIHLRVLNHIRATVERGDASPRLIRQDKFAVPETAERGAGLTADDVNQGWISLFDGTSLFGWQAESDANWRVEDGCIVVDNGSAPGLLRTTSQFDDYELRLEFQAEKDTNSGVFVRTSPRPNDPTMECVEINIAPSTNPFPTGSIVGHVKTTETFSGVEWHRMSIKVSSRQVDIQVDDRPSATLADTAPFGRGYVGLQYNSGAVRFRNIRLKPTGLASTFNGRDLQGWKTYDLMPGRFSIAPNNVLQARGGPGQLETETQYADFVMQFKCRTNADGLNSGVFFRCIPGEQMKGYEIQIDNAFIDGDRNKPMNGGTGAIFRRNEARRVVASDQEWSAITAIAVGPRIAVWVNGHQVTDWKDDRPKHANPRNGRRLVAGTIILQAHDETTDVSFADIFAAELSQREKGNGVDLQSK